MLVYFISERYAIACPSVVCLSSVDGCHMYSDGYYMFLLHYVLTTDLLHSILEELLLTYDRNTSCTLAIFL